MKYYQNFFGARVLKSTVSGWTLAISSREESHFFDRKACGINGKKAQKISVAFANADGGEFVVGIADDKDEANPNRRWKGFTTLEEMNGILQSIFDITPSLDIRYEILNCSTKPGNVLRVTIEKSSEVHKTADGTVYQRYGAQSLPIKDPQKITELSFAKGAASFEDQLLKDIPAELVVESKELAEFLEGLKQILWNFALTKTFLISKPGHPELQASFCFIRPQMAQFPGSVA